MRGFLKGAGYRCVVTEFLIEAFHIKLKNGDKWGLDPDNINNKRV